MGRIFLVDLEEQDIPNRYLCKTCRTQIASSADYIMLHTDFEFVGGIFEKAVNVLVDPSEKHRENRSHHLVAKVHCITCCNYLGFKYISVHPHENHVLRPNTLKLIMSKLENQVGDEYFEGGLPGLAEDTSHLLEQLNPP